MLNKVTGLARALAILLAVVAGFVAVPTNVALVLVILGVIAGIGYGADDLSKLALATLVLPAVGTAVGNIPAVGAQLGAVSGNVALATAGALATIIALRLYGTLVGDLKGLAG
ncbi:MAG: hypothetical protein RLZZ136_915 [Pseudomonadota bacterium]